MAIQVAVPFDATHPRALAVYCSDGRFTEAVRLLLLELGHDRLDTLTIPGGAATLNLLLVRGAASFLIRGHQIEHAVLIAHADCGFYRSRCKGRTAEAIEQAQVADLSTSARMLARSHDGLRVSLYYARPGASGVVFDPLEVAGAAAG
jgi:hypothetical protein